MTPEQWTTLAGQLGVGGGAVFVLAKMIVPLLTSKMDAIITAQRDTIAAVERNTAAVATTTAAVASLSERVSRLEGIYDHTERTPVETPIRGEYGLRRTKP